MNKIEKRIVEEMKYCRDRYKKICSKVKYFNSGLTSKDVEYNARVLSSIKNCLNSINDFTNQLEQSKNIIETLLQINNGAGFIYEVPFTKFCKGIINYIEYSYNGKSKKFDLKR